ncbi:MAG: endolytic transglycosylase MltG [bacterium]
MRRRYIILILTLILLVVLLICSMMIRSILSPKEESGVERIVKFRVNKGETTSSVARRLENEGLIKNKTAFITFVEIRGYDKRLQAGLYQLSPKMSTIEILDILVNGRIYTIDIIIPEGFTIEMIADRLSSKGLCDKKRFIELCHKPELFDGIPKEAKTLEGYLFPDTYRFSPDATEEEIIRTMIDNFNQVYKKVSKGYSGKLNENQIITLASIIEKEAYFDNEKPIISAVFQNRFKKGMRLESCATILYIVKRPEGPVYYADLKVDNPYNTYKYTGLPPGPISCPGKKSIESALYPDKNDYLYFVSLGDGTHHFSKTFTEHEKYRLEKERFQKQK